MAFALSLHTDPRVNRCGDPGDPIGPVARDLHGRDLQPAREFIAPSRPAPVIRRVTRQTARALALMTGPNGRLNHFGHPDAEVRRCDLDRFECFNAFVGDLGGLCVGTRVTIFTDRDCGDRHGARG